MPKRDPCRALGDPARRSVLTGCSGSVDTMAVVDRPLFIVHSPRSGTTLRGCSSITMRRLPFHLRATQSERFPVFSVR